MRFPLATILLLSGISAACAQAPYANVPNSPTIATLPPKAGVNRGASTKYVDDALTSMLSGTIIAADPPINLKCDGTDETAKLALLSTAIGAGGKKVIIPRGTCTASSWSLAGKHNVTLEGQGGLDMNFDAPGSEFMCTRADTGVCFDFTNMKGLLSRDIAYGYNSGVFAGTLIDLHSDSSIWNKHRFDNFQFYQKGTHTNTANRLVFLYETVDTTFSHGRFAHAQNGIVGAADGANAASSAVMKCYACDFVLVENFARNPGLQWQWIGSNVEPTATGAPSRLLAMPGYDVSTIGFFGTTFSDSSAPGAWMEFRGSVFGLTIHGGSMAGDIYPQDGISPITGIVFSGPFTSNISIQGMQFAHLNGVDFSGTTSCNGISVQGGFPTSQGDNVKPMIGWEKCVNTNFAGSYPAIGHYGATPTVSACGTGPVIGGNDFAGSVSTGAGATSCTITFGAAWSQYPRCQITSMGGTPPIINRTATSLQLVNTSAFGTYDYSCSDS